MGIQCISSTRKAKMPYNRLTNICSAYGEVAVAERTVRKRFSGFKPGDLNLEDEERLGSLFTTNVDQIKTLIKINPNLKMYCSRIDVLKASN